MGAQRGYGISTPGDIQNSNRHCSEKSGIVWISFQVVGSGDLQKSFSTCIIMHIHKYA